MSATSSFLTCNRCHSQGHAACSCPNPAVPTPARPEWRQEFALGARHDPPGIETVAIYRAKFWWKDSNIGFPYGEWYESELDALKAALIAKKKFAGDFPDAFGSDHGEAAIFQLYKSTRKINKNASS